MQTCQVRTLIETSDLFHPTWYQQAYPDVGTSGLSALDHFIQFGLPLDRDPGPDFCTTFFRYATDPAILQTHHPVPFYIRHPETNIEGSLVLQAVLQVQLKGRHTQALKIAERYLPAHLRQTIDVLHANQAILMGATTGWREALNRYLAFHDLAPIMLRSAQTLLGQLHCGPLTAIKDGPLISIIMPVWNAQDTVEVAIQSILDQTWRQLELIVVDDASTDHSWTILCDLAARDSRIKLRRNATNVGPYVSKNLGLMQASGGYITGHDADDWAHPQRLETHMRFVQTSPRALPVTMPYGLRMQPNGLFSNVRRAERATSHDGWMQSTPIGTLFAADFLHNKLGYWNSVRFGADTEILLRARHVLGHGPLELPILSMICLDAPGSLSNDTDHGTRVDAAGLSPTRRAYLQSVRDWLLMRPNDSSVHMAFPETQARYAIPAQMRVPHADILRNLSQT